MPPTIGDRDLRALGSATVSALYTDGGTSARDGYLYSLVDAALNTVRLVHAAVDRLEPAAVCAESDGFDCYVTEDKVIHLGLAFLRALDTAAVAPAAFLLANLELQLAPVAGDLPSLAEVFDVDVAPANALRLFSPGWMDTAYAAHGYAKRPFQSILESVASLKASEDGARGAGLLTMPKPTLNPRLFFRGTYGRRAAIDKYLNPNDGAHRSRLHHQLLCDSILFAVAHECAHLALDHFVTGSTLPEHDQEIAADEFALDVLLAVPEAHVRSIFALFAFIQQHEYEISARSHPLSKHRFISLAHIVQTRRHDPVLRADLSVALAFLETPLSPVKYRVSWPDGKIDDVEVQVYQQTDTDYGATVNCYVDHPPRLMSHQGLNGVGALLKPLRLRASVSIHTLKDVSSVIGTAEVVLNPQEDDISMYVVTSEGTIAAHQSARVELSPDWWLERPDIALTITNIELAEPEDDSRSRVVLPSPAEYPTLGQIASVQTYRALSDYSRLLLAARRFSEIGRSEQAAELYGHVFERNSTALQGPDLVAYLAALDHAGRVVDAGSVAKTIVESHRVWPPGMHLCLAKAALADGDSKSAFDESFIEWFGIGEYGPFHKEAQALWVHILKVDSSSGMESVREFFAWSMPVENQRIKGMFAESRRRMFRRHAETALARAVADWGRSSVALRELLYETQLELNLEDAVALERVRKQFELFAVECPQFAPPRLQLARIAMAQGSETQARALWNEARMLAPMSEQVLAFGDVLQPARRTLFGTTTSTRLLRSVERQSLGCGAIGAIARMLLPIVRLVTVPWLLVVNRLRYAKWAFRNR